MNVFRRIAPLTVILLVLLTAESVSAEDPPMTERQMGPFLIRAEFDLSEIEVELKSLGELYSEITQTLRLPPLREGIEIRVFADESRWREFFRQKFAGAPYSRAMFVRKNLLLDRSGNKGKVYLFRNPRLGDDLRHECVHAILAGSLRKDLPVWLDEGLAEYYEIPADRAANKTWLPRTRARLQNGLFQKLERLEKLTGMMEMTTENYGDAWAWVTFMLNGPAPVREILPQYLNDLAERRFFPASVSRRLMSISGSGTGETLRRYFNGP